MYVLIQNILKLKQLLIIIIALFVFNCRTSNDLDDDNLEWHSRVVTATAYNSLVYQTDLNPNITAFGDSLQPGLKYIAVSRDLLKLGLKHNTPVIIGGLEGVFLVKDKMHSRWRNSIDIYMGEDVKRAKNWGRKRVCIDYGLSKKE